MNDKEKRQRCIFKYNSGMGAILCSECSVIIKVGYQFSKEEIDGIKGKVHIPPQYCDKCKTKQHEGNNDI